MFTLDLNPEFTWPFTARLPVHGQFADCQAVARFRLLPESQRTQLQPQGDGAVLAAALVGIDGAKGGDGKPFENTEANLARLLDLLPFRTALAEAYAAAVYGSTPSAAALGN